MAIIFISYNRQNRGIANSLAEDFAALGHKVWLDQELSGGQPWWDQILANVRGCDLFVFVMDPESLASTACKREYRYAADIEKPILPVLVADGVSTNLLPPALSQIQFVDYRARDHHSALQLAKAIGLIPPAKPLPDPLPPPPAVPISYLGDLTTEIDADGELGYEIQTRLVLELKGAMRDPGTARDAQTLLERMRKRKDLRATVAAEIDELVARQDPPAATTSGGLETTPLTTDQLRERNTQSTVNTSNWKTGANTSGDLSNAPNRQPQNKQQWQPPPPPPVPPASVPNYLVLSILSTVLCCVPAGVVSIIYAAQANTKSAAGDIEGGMAAARNAKTWAIVSAVVGLIVGIIYFILAIANVH